MTASQSAKEIISKQISAWRLERDRVALAAEDTSLRKKVLEALIEEGRHGPTYLALIDERDEKARNTLVNGNPLHNYDGQLPAFLHRLEQIARTGGLQYTSQFLKITADSLDGCRDYRGGLNGVGRFGANAWRNALDVIFGEIDLCLNGIPSLPILPIRELQLKYPAAYDLLILNNGCTTIGLLLRQLRSGEGTYTLRQVYIRDISGELAKMQQRNQR